MCFLKGHCRFQSLFLLLCPLSAMCEKPHKWVIYVNLKFTKLQHFLSAFGLWRTLFVYLAISAATSAEAVGICKSPDVNEELLEIDQGLKNEKNCVTKLEILQKPRDYGLQINYIKWLVKHGRRMSSFTNTPTKHWRGIQFKNVVKLLASNLI